MDIEVLISTMNKKDLSLISNMNIKTDAIIINQCGKESLHEEVIEGKRIRMLSYDELGLSKSRNRGLENSDADICIIADDDLVYEDDYEAKIVKAYKLNPDADIIAFSVPSINLTRPTSELKKGNVKFLNSMKIASFQITFKRRSFIENNLKFNENFGAGAKYICGEENILLAKAIKKRLRIVYVDSIIATVNHKESTWYSGFSERYFRTKGAMFYEMSHVLAPALVIQFAIRKIQLYKKERTFSEAIAYMMNGVKEYKNKLNDEV